jgi:hypothetical protein
MAVHEIKYDGYRMHARIDGGKATLLTRTGLDWSHRYKRTIEALGSLKVKSAYLDGELCAWVANRRSVARAKRNAARLGARAALTLSLHSGGYGKNSRNGSARQELPGCRDRLVS